jgi:hypothetical protein
MGLFSVPKSRLRQRLPHFHTAASKKEQEQEKRFTIPRLYGAPRRKGRSMVALVFMIAAVLYLLNYLAGRM